MPKTYPWLKKLMPLAALTPNCAISISPVFNLTVYFCLPPKSEKQMFQQPNKENSICEHLELTWDTQNSSCISCYCCVKVKLGTALVKSKLTRIQMFQGHHQSNGAIVTLSNLNPIWNFNFNAQNVKLSARVLSTLKAFFDNILNIGSSLTISKIV